jgi:ABC-type polysaccharide/polyol phosphate export permease
LFGALVVRQVRLRVKRSVLGVWWPLTAPLFLLALYSVVFNSVFKVPVEDYPIFLFCGLLPWTFLVQSINDALQSLTRDGELVRRSRYPYALLPLSSVGVFCLPFLVLLVAFMAFLAARGTLDVSYAPLVLVPTIAVVLLASSIGIALAIIDVFSRDLRHVLNNLMTLWFYLVPIVYRPSMATGPLRALRSVDPMNMIVGQFRDILLYGKVSRPTHFVLMFAVCVLCFVVATSVAHRVNPVLPKYV